MAIQVEKGTWTASGSTPQTVSLVDSSLTPIAIIPWTSGPGAAGSFAAGAPFSMGFGTRRGAATQSGCVGIFSADNVATSDTARIRNTTLLILLANTSSTDYTVTLDSFGTGQFTVSYSSAAAASGDIFHYIVFGGADLTDANVVNWTMAATSGAEAITGVGFQPDVLFSLDSNLATTNARATASHFGFGFASSATKFGSFAMTATDGDTATSTMNWNRSYRTDACMERLTLNADTSDSRWDLDSFDADGASLGVVDAPGSTDRIATFLFIKGGVWEAGSKAKDTDTGADTYTLANSTLTPTGVLLFTTNQTAVGVATGSTDFCIGAGDGTHVGVAGNTGPETISTTSDRFHATDRIIEELTGGTSPAETSEATLTSFNAGNFILNWAVNGGSSALLGFLAFGATASGASYNMITTGMAVAGAVAASPLSLSMQQSLAFATAGGMTQGGARSAVLQNALVQAAAMPLTDTLTMQQVLALGVVAGIDPRVNNALALTLALACGSTLDSASTLTQTIVTTLATSTAYTEQQVLHALTGTALSADVGLIPTAALEAALLAFISGEASTTAASLLSVSLATELGVQGALTETHGLEMTLAATLLSDATLAPSQSLTRTVAAALAVQSALSLTTLADLQLVLALAQSSLLTPTSTREATLTQSFATSAALTALAEILTLLTIQVTLPSSAGLSTVQQFTAIGQTALAAQAMLTHSSIGVFGVLSSLASQGTLSVLLPKIHEAAFTLSSGASIAVLADIVQEYLLSVGLDATISLTDVQQHELVLRIVEDVTAALQAQQIAQYTTLISLGVLPLQAVAATATMQLLTALSVQTLLTAAAQVLGANAPNVIRIVNELLLRSLVSNETLQTPAVTEEQLLK